MKLLYLTPPLDESNGWGRFAVGFLREAKARLGSENVIVPDPATLRSSRRGWQTPFLAMQDRNALRKVASRCDLIHAAYENLAPLAMMLAMVTGKPYIVSVHGTYADLRVYPWYLRWLFSKAFAKADVIVPVSRYTESIIKTQFPDVQTEVIPGGFTPPHVMETARDGKSFRILAVGALKPRKGFHTLIQAIALLKEQDSILDIVGPESFTAYAARLREMIAEKQLESRVTLHGRIPQEELDAFYARADLFVLPSEHDGVAFEGLGLVYLEALAHGVPVIGARDSGAEDVIRDGENGFLVKPGDASALAEKIARLYGDRQLLAELASRARESIKAFRWDVVGGKMHEVYESCRN